jgi:hypothetical protein
MLFGKRVRESALGMEKNRKKANMGNKKDTYVGKRSAKYGGPLVLHERNSLLQHCLARRR